MFFCYATFSARAWIVDVRTWYAVWDSAFAKFHKTSKNSVVPWFHLKICWRSTPTARRGDQPWPEAALCVIIAFISLSVYSVTVFRTALAFKPSVPYRACRNTHEGPLSFIGPRSFLALFPVSTHPIPPTGHSFKWVHLFLLLMQVRLCFSSVPTVLWSH